MKKTTGLVPLRNFAKVSTGIYRSAQPLYKYEYRWLSKVLKIKTIVNLRAEADIDEKEAKKYGIKVVNIRVPDHNPPTKRQADGFIKLIQAHTGALLFHCEHGHGRTSTFCVLSRIAQGWKLERALKEEETRFHYEFKHAHQLEFLKKYFK